MLHFNGSFADECGLAISVSVFCYIFKRKMFQDQISSGFYGLLWRPIKTTAEVILKQPFVIPVTQSSLSKQ